MESRLHIVWFYFLGVLVFLPALVVVWIANEDILAGSSLPSTIVLIGCSMDIIGKLMAVLVVQRMPLLLLMTLHSIALAGGFVLIVLLHVNVRVIGVVAIGYAYGFGVVLYLGQSANFGESEKLSGAFISGSNLATILASIGYTGLTTWTCLAPRTVLASCVPLCFVTLVFYPFLANKSSTRQKMDATKYHALPQAPASKDTKSSALSTKMNFILKVFPYASYMFVANFCLAVSLTSALTTITFPSSPFIPRDHYQYYRLVSDFGIALGGIEVVLASSLCPKFLTILRIKRVWVLAVLHSALTVFFVFTSWLRLVPNVYVLLALVFLQGIIHGLLIVHVMAWVSCLFDDARETAVAIGYAETAFSCGRLLAALLGIYVEDTLKHHCYNALLLGKYCFARIPTTNGWETNVHC